MANIAMRAIAAAAGAGFGGTLVISAADFSVGAVIKACAAVFAVALVVFAGVALGAGSYPAIIVFSALSELAFRAATDGILCFHIAGTFCCSQTGFLAVDFLADGQVFGGAVIFCRAAVVFGFVLANAGVAGSDFAGGCLAGFGGAFRCCSAGAIANAAGFIAGFTSVTTHSARWAAENVFGDFVIVHKVPQRIDIIIVICSDYETFGGVAFTNQDCRYFFVTVFAGLFSATPELIFTHFAKEILCDSAFTFTTDQFKGIVSIEIEGPLTIADAVTESGLSVAVANIPLGVLG